VDIPHWKDIPDHFVWNAFDWASSSSDGSLGPGAAQQEALLAETENFYVIPDQFGVVSGHVLILPKEEQTSVACLDPSFDDEITWLLECVANIVTTEYEAQVVIAEHGECGCATANQAHIHVLPIPKTVTPTELRATIDHVLRRRMIGIDRIAYRGTDFTALEDLQSLIDVDGADITGRQLQCSDFTNDGTYPAAARTASGLIRPYVYFAGPGVRFVSIRSFRSQFVREVVCIATSQPPGAWDRRVHTQRSNMFDTFARLAPAFSQYDDAMYEFKPRGGRSITAVSSPASPIAPTLGATLEWRGIDHPVVFRASDQTARLRAQIR
jgi:diadenosine tetraphosphate (Ap4A) HIT family hydrolase